jgi:hypothetical protein
LLLLMLALYDATGNGLQSDDETFDIGQLYERLLSEFADREVRRVHAGRPESAMPELIEAELLRLSVVAFAMFHRLRLWATTEELDADLAGLGLRASREAGSEGFRAPITAGQEMVGRFFFIQRAQAHQDDRTRQTYEFLHATFGEYLVARLVVQALRDAAARARARTLQLGSSDEDDLLQSLLGFTPLCARTTVLPFAADLLRGPDTAQIREWLVDRLRTAVTRPQYVPRRYQPVDKRIDHWMATYSFNLMLLTLACGGTVRASELFRRAKDPADWLRDSALQWRAAVPASMFLDALEPLAVTRGWAADGRRDLILEHSPGAGVDDVDPFWSHGFAPDWDFRDSPPGSGFSEYFPLGPALTSMQLSNALSEDALRHALEPMLHRLPEAVETFTLHGRDDTESVAHALVHMWLASALGDEPARLLSAYDRAAVALVGKGWGLTDTANSSPGHAIRMVLRSLGADAHRLPSADVVRLALELRSSEWFDYAVHLLPLVECLLADPAPLDDQREALIAGMLLDLGAQVDEMAPEDCLSLLVALSGARFEVSLGMVAAIDERLATPSVRERMRATPDLFARLMEARRRLPVL